MIRTPVFLCSIAKCQRNKVGQAARSVSSIHCLKHSFIGLDWIRYQLLGSGTSSGY